MGFVILALRNLITNALIGIINSVCLLNIVISVFFVPRYDDRIWTKQLPDAAGLGSPIGRSADVRMALPQGLHRIAGPTT